MDSNQKGELIILSQQRKGQLNWLQSSNSFPKLFYLQILRLYLSSVLFSFYCRIDFACFFFLLFSFAVCDDGYYGYKCKKTCQCELPNMDAACDHRDGQCHCDPGHTNIYCNQSMLCFFSFGWSDFKLIIQRDMHFLSVEGLQFSFLFVIQCFLLNWSLIPATSVRKKLILVLKCILSLSPISSRNPWSCPEDCDPRSFGCDQRSNRTTSLKTSKENVLQKLILC